MASVKKIIIIFAAALLLFAPAVALCDISDASDIVYEEESIPTDGFSFGQQPENNTLTIVVLLILTVILVVVLVLMLRLRKKMNDGHY